MKYYFIIKKLTKCSKIKKKEKVELFENHSSNAIGCKYFQKQ